MTRCFMPSSYRTGHLTSGTGLLACPSNLALKM
jgi:hypothetical protein